MTCGTTFTTSEAVDLSGSVTVRDMARLEPFQRDKLFMSVYDNLKHRKTVISDATGLTDTIISKLYPLMTDAVLDKHDIIKTASEVLRRFDKAAATMYDAYHPKD